MRAAWTLDEGSDFVNDIFGFTVTEAFFAPDERYNQGQTLLLHWLGRDKEGKVYGAGEFHPSWPVPEGFVSIDGGQTIRHPEGKLLNKRGYYGKLCSLVDGLVPKGPGDPLENFDPQEAKGWVGLTFDLQEVEVEFGKNVGTKKRLMPTAFYKGGQVAATAAPAAAAGGDTLESKVIALAKVMPTYESFQAAALGLPGVSGNNALLARIVDREASGIYAQAKK